MFSAIHSSYNIIMKSDFITYIFSRLLFTDDTFSYFTEKVEKRGGVKKEFLHDTNFKKSKFYHLSDFY